ncbi:MAG TPA: hypothetical protein VID70_05605 [Solirubrobacteraceae bacterium]|jgi:hypothetical protein
MATEIRSYRSVFDLERRIYRVDRVRLNPAGVPVRGAVYFAALLLTALLLAALPLVGAPARLLPWYLRDLALPACAAALLTMVRIDGRSFHLAAWALVGYVLGPRRIGPGGVAAEPSGARWRPQALVVLPDGSEGRLRRLRCRGPALVSVAVAHERVEWSRGVLSRLARRESVTVRELPDRRAPAHAQRVALGPGTQLRVR